MAAGSTLPMYTFGNKVTFFRQAATGRRSGRRSSHKGWGLTVYRASSIPSGKATYREFDEYLLTEMQVYLFCMRSELPDIEEVQPLIADVFSEITPAAPAPRPPRQDDPTSPPAWPPSSQP